MKKKCFLTLLSICIMLCISLFGCTQKPIPETKVDTEPSGSPKKYFTISCDDGITQDARIISILKKYNAKATFFINSGLLGEDWSEMVSGMIDVDVSHKRFTKEEIESGIYEGMDVACHTYSHPSMVNVSAIEQVLEVEKDVKNITDMTGITPVGMAWPGGDSVVDDKCVEIVNAYTSVRFARCTTSTCTFKLPERFLRWYPTASITEPNVLLLADDFIAADCEEDMLFYVWLHGYELDAYDAWDIFEALVQKMANADGICIVTNTEFYNIFSEKIPS